MHFSIVSFYMGGSNIYWKEMMNKFHPKLSWSFFFPSEKIKLLFLKNTQGFGDRKIIEISMGWLVDQFVGCLVSWLLGCLVSCFAWRRCYCIFSGIESIQQRVAPMLPQTTEFIRPNTHDTIGSFPGSAPEKDLWCGIPTSDPSQGMK